MPHIEEPRDATFDFSDADLPEFGFETPEEASTNGSSGCGSTTNGHGATASATGGVSTPEPDGSDDEAIAQAVSAVDGDHSVEPNRPTPAAVEELRETIRGLDEKTRRMLAYYDEHGPTTPLDAHFVAGGTGDRTDAYAHNRELRLAGLVEHVGRGNYDTCIRERLDEATDGRLDGDELAVYRAQLAADYGVDGF